MLRPQESQVQREKGRKKEALDSQINRTDVLTSSITDGQTHDDQTQTAGKSWFKFGLD